MFSMKHIGFHLKTNNLLLIEYDCTKKLHLDQTYIKNYTDIYKWKCGFVIGIPWLDKCILNYN